jgi:hypothetical protein
MTNDLGVWTADDCALVLIDYQREMFEVIRVAGAGWGLLGHRPKSSPQAV